MKYYVYILRSESNGRYYVGHTKNLARRVARHNQGNTRWSKNRGPWNLVHSEELPSRGEAIKREKYIKLMKSRSYISRLIETRQS